MEAAVKKKNNEAECIPRRNIQMQTQQNKRKCSKATNEMTPSQENQTTKENRTRKEEKEEPTQEDNWNTREKEPRETHQEDQEPDTLGRLIEEWMGAENEQWGKTTSPREDKNNRTHHTEQQKQQNTQSRSQGQEENA